MSLHPTFRATGLHLAAVFGLVASLVSCGSNDAAPVTANAGGSSNVGGAAGTTSAGGAGGVSAGGGGATSVGGSGGSTAGAAGVSAGGSGPGGASGTGGTGGTGGAGGVAGTTPPDSGAGGAGGAGGTTDGGVSTGTFTARRWFSSENSPLNNASPDSTLANAALWNAGPLPLTYKLDEQSKVPITVPGGTATTTINVDPANTYQSMLGFGNSMEESSVANIRKLSAAKRTEILTSIVDPVNGMGQNLFRITMGTSDFTGQPWYSYDDGAADPNMDRFSIQKDIDDGIIGVLKDMLAINPNVMFFGSVWSPPGWMKDSNTMNGGNLVSSNIPALAKYFRKFVEAYKAQGIPVYAVTLQNEPQYSTNGYPTCTISAAQEIELVKAVKAEFTAGSIDTKIWIFDHNFDNGLTYAPAVLADAAAAAATDGVAWHDYGGDPTSMTTIHNAYPNKDMLFTEKTLWGVAGVERVAQYIRNWSRSYVSWLTMLDQTGKPNNGPNSGKLRRFVKAVPYPDGGLPNPEYWPTAEHWLFGLYSKFVMRDAKRISSTVGTVATVTSVAFLNPDNSIVTVVMNQSISTQQFVLASEGNQIWSQIPAHTAATYVWSKGLGKATAAAVAPTN